MDERVNILLVDDREDKLLALDSILAELNQNVIKARSGKEALRMLLSSEFSVVLLDVNMPDMDGFETASLIRQRKKTETTPIIFISAADNPETHVSRGYSLGAVDYITSPIIPEILRAKVAVFVDLFKKTEQIRRQAEERARLIREQAARAEAESAQLRFSFLAEASARFGRSLEYEETFQTLTSVAVPFIADCCLVHIPAGEAFRERSLYTRMNPEQAQRMRDQHGRETEILHECFAGVIEQVMTQDVAVHVPQVTPDQLPTLTTRPELQMLLNTFGLSSYVAAPLVARGRNVGVVCYVRAQPYYTFGEADFRLAEELTRRASQALDNARLYFAAQEARREAERANQAKDQFLAMLSHELRTPLTPVLNAVSELDQDRNLPPHAQSALDMIRRNVELEARLIDDLLDLTRISNGKVQLNVEVLDAEELVRNVIDICRDDIAAKNLDVTVQLEAPKHHVRADSARLQQILWNLLKNAIKFTPTGGKIEITTRNLREEEICFEVRDSGIGIEPALLPRIFNAFEQGHSMRFGGLGLGLAISKALVGMHGGSIAAYSSGLGEGATFRVSMAVVPYVEEPRREQPSAATESEHAGSRILLVDDHEDTRESMQRLLERRGYVVQGAADIRSALDVARSFSFDILISDIGLPDGTGIDLFRLLRNLNPNFKGIAVSGFGMEEDVRRSKDQGFSGHLTKPVDIRRLEEEISRALKPELAEA